MRIARRPAWLPGLVLLAAAGCARPAGPARWLERARADNRQADEDLARGDLDAARDRLAALLDSPRPAGLAAADARLVRQDACYRLAEIELSADRPRQALAWADRGLALDGRGDLFVANLYIQRGRALEGLGRDKKAAAAYRRALLINEQLLAETLSPGEGSGS